MNYNRWGERSGILTWEFPYKTLAGAGQVFIYLMYDKEPVSYAKFNAADF